MFTTQYEIEHVHLAPYFSKARKIDALGHVGLKDEEYSKIEKSILAGETKEEVFARAEEEDRTHWVNYYGHLAATDLLTLGKVQPETMFAMSLLPEEDFKEVVQIATKTARHLDKVTVKAESDLNVNSIPKDMI